MVNPTLRIPFINPVKFVLSTQANLEKYWTKHFDDYLFEDRLLPWEQPEAFTQIWQTTDILNLQFLASFDPIIFSVVDKSGRIILQLPALRGLADKFNAGQFAFEIQNSFAGFDTGCYRFKIEAGSGLSKRTYISDRQFISAEAFQFANLLLQYWHHRYHENVLFESGIKFEMRLPGHFGRVNPGTNNVSARDEYFNQTILSSRTFRQMPLYFCDERGMPDDFIDKLNRIWTCRNVLVDREPFAAVDGKFNIVEIPRYPLRGVNLIVEPGINRMSKIYTQDVDTTQRLISVAMVDVKVFGDLSNQGSANSVPVNNYE